MSELPYQQFCDKLDKLDGDFKSKMEDQNTIFFADKPEEQNMTPELREHYEKFEKMIQEHTEKFSLKMQEHTEQFKKKYKSIAKET